MVGSRLPVSGTTSRPAVVAHAQAAWEACPSHRSNQECSLAFCVAVHPVDALCCRLQAEAAALVADWTAEEREYLRDEVPRGALATPFRGGTVQDLAKQVGEAQQGWGTPSLGWQERSSRGRLYLAAQHPAFACPCDLPAALRSCNDAFSQVLAISKGGLQRRGKEEAKFLKELEAIAESGVTQVRAASLPVTCRCSSLPALFFIPAAKRGHACGSFIWCVSSRCVPLLWPLQADRLLEFYNGPWQQSVDPIYSPDFTY